MLKKDRKSKISQSIKQNWLPLSFQFRIMVWDHISFFPSSFFKATAQFPNGWNTICVGRPWRTADWSVVTILSSFFQPMKQKPPNHYELQIKATFLYVFDVRKQTEVLRFFLQPYSQSYWIFLIIHIFQFRYFDTPLYCPVYQYLNVQPATSAFFQLLQRALAFGWDFVTAVLKGKGVQWQEIARFARLHATYFYLDSLVLQLLFPVNHFCN